MTARRIVWNRHAAVTALAAGVVVLAGCGSTVQNAGSPTFAGGAGGSGGTSTLTVPGQAGAAGTPSGGSGATTLGSTGGGTGAAGSSASGGGSTTGGGAGTSTGTSSGGSSGTGGTTTAAGSDGPGVTATTINIAAAYEPDAAAADSALGAANANPGDTKAEEDAVIKYINAHGGVAHRKIVPIWYKASVTQDANTTFQKACTYWTQDHKVFVLGGGSPILDQCTANAHAIGVQAGAIVLETSAMNRKYPADVNLTGLTIDRAMSVTINGLSRQGYFSGGAKVGLVTWDDPYYRYGISTAAQPALGSLGIHNAPVEYVTVPQSYGDLGATSASVSSAVLKFREMGIDHVILFDGAAGVNSSGVLVLEWMQQAQSQHYNPRYGLNSTSGFSSLASDYPQQQMANSVGVGWAPSLDLSSTDFDSIPLPPNGKLCLQIMKAANQEQSGGNAKGLQLAICDGLFFLKQALDPITGPLNQQTALAAINAMGSRFVPSSTFGVFLSSTRHDGASLVRNMAFVPSCTCYRYTSKPYTP